MRGNYGPDIYLYYSIIIPLLTKIILNSFFYSTMFGEIEEIVFGKKKHIFALRRMKDRGR